MQLETIIGLEIHVQLKTKSKLFCRCDNTGENQPPNTTICPICLGHPGVLPVLNKEALNFALKAALALGCKINNFSRFERKNYFYPDLPKGYQITQYAEPLAKGGYLIIETEDKKRRVRISDLHLEEDAAKSIHSRKATLVDFNRSGTPLIEIVTKPDLRSPKEAKVFLKELRLIMRYLEISDADMEKGHLRCDANISLRKKGEIKFYPKSEIKNLNSFHSVEKALLYEESRQKKLWVQGKPPARQTTFGWLAKKEATKEQRVKEELHDYRYFPEPDLPPLSFSENVIKKIKSEIPELPDDRRKRFVGEMGMSEEVARILVEDKRLAWYAEKVISELRAWFIAEDPQKGAQTWQKNQPQVVKLAIDWLLNKLVGFIEAKKITLEKTDITPENFAELIKIIFKKTINTKAAQEVLKEMIGTRKDPSEIVREKGLALLSDEKEIEKSVLKIIKNNPEVVAKYKKGKGEVLQFLIGQVMRETKGKAEAALISKILKKNLSVDK